MSETYGNSRSEHLERHRQQCRITNQRKRGWAQAEKFFGTGSVGCTEHRKRGGAQADSQEPFVSRESRNNSSLALSEATADDSVRRSLIAISGSAFVLVKLEYRSFKL